MNKKIKAPKVYREGQKKLKKEVYLFFFKWQKNLKEIKKKDKKKKTKEGNL